MVWYDIMYGMYVIYMMYTMHLWFEYNMYIVHMIVSVYALDVPIWYVYIHVCADV